MGTLRTSPEDHAVQGGQGPRPLGRIPALLALLAVVAAAVGAWLAEGPPAPAGPDAPATTFSATRAWPHLAHIAREPTPIGSPGGDAVRNYLVDRLIALGLRPEVQTGVGARTFGADVTAGLAKNVVAVIPGHASTGRVVVAAHYDSTPTTPGTSDDKASVAAVLEIARALTAGGQLRNDVVLLLSDGEEPGLIGAEAFARHPLAQGGSVMINLEGPGNASPSSMYNLTPGGSGLISAFAQVPFPVGESAVTGVYRLSGFHSDLSVLEERGVIGVDLGWSDGRAYYHHPRDTVANFDPAALQMQGENALVMVREVANADLPQLRAAPEEVFFAAFGTVIGYPGWLATPLAGAGVLAVLAFAVLARLRGEATVPRLVLSAAAALIPLMIGMAGAAGLWAGLTAWDRGYASLASDPYQPGPFRLAIILMVVAIVWGWFALARRWLGPVAPVAGVLFWQALLGVAAAVFLPGASYYGALTALAGGAGGCAALVLRDRRPLFALAVWTVAALPGVVVFGIGGRSLGSALGLAMAAPSVVFYMFAAMSALPLLDAATPRARVLAALGPLLAGVLAVVMAGAGVVVNRFDQERPRVAHLAYVLSADSGRAAWVSMDAQPHPWVAERAREATGAFDLPLPHRQSPARVGPAVAADLPAPEVTVLEERRRGDTTVLRLRVRSARSAYQLNLQAGAPVIGGTIEAYGESPVPLPIASEQSGPWPFEVQFFAPPPQGVTFELHLRGRTTPKLAVSDMTVGLTDIPGYRPRPLDLERTPSTGGLVTDSVTVVRTIEGRRK
ncbi:M28 family peptidase [Sinosporangium siamense]|uniref:Aminopeptidase n=1 Tax=Sinosporangium siamense TaxID=1367973 RepID=A0A919RNU5_9ACTN|nr:M28 family peptidase [Sinosporangium siamense]GII95424.1 aminopeptidase [Sinosporangium siamense]